MSWQTAVVMVLIYIDPGAGSMVIQALLAAVLAVPFFFRTQAAALIRRVRRVRSEPDETPES